MIKGNENISDNRFKSVKVNTVEQENIIPDQDIDLRYIQTNEFYRIARDFFQFEKNKEETYSQKKKNCLRFYSFNLPEQLNSYFIPYEDAPLFLTFETKFMMYIEEFIRFNFPQKAYADYYQLIKDFFNKWNQVKYPEEKRYFASSILNYYEKDPNKHNFLNTILTGIILCYDPSVKNVPGGVYLFDRTAQILETLKLNEVHKKELLCLTEIFAGFGKITINKFEEAKVRFTRALDINPNSITAKYYLAYVENKLLFFDITENIINEIFQADIGRLTFAIENNNAVIFNYFLSNTLFKNLFLEEVFSDNIASILKIMQAQSADTKIHPKELLSLIEELERLDCKAVGFDKVKTDVGHIKEILKPNIESRNIFFSRVFPSLIDRIKAICESVIESIRVLYIKDIKENLSPFDNEIKEKLNNISNLGVELEESKKQLKIKQEEAIKHEERESSYNITLIEGKIENLSLERKYDPVNSFKTTMIYNLIISFMISILGGCAGYSNIYVKTSGELNSILSTIILTGFKWGIVTFFVGFLISLFSASISIIERANKKQKLLTRIKYLKNKTEIEKQRILERFQAKEKSLIDNFTDRINDNKKRIEDVKLNKASIEVKLKADAEHKITEDTEPLNYILKKIG